MYCITLYLCALFSTLLALEPQPISHSIVLQNEHALSSPLEFPQKTDSSTPILVGTDPKVNNLPPKMFPSMASGQHSSGPPVLSVTDAKQITEIKTNHEVMLNSTHEIELPEKSNSSITKTQENLNSTGKQVLEQDDMLNSKYKGGHDVDELHPEKNITEEHEKKDQTKPEKKATEKEEKKTINPKKDPKSEVDVSPSLDKRGPKLMNETKQRPGESIMESTSKMMAVSSSVLSSTQVNKHQGIIEPAKTIVSVLLSVVFILGVGVIGLIVWKKIAMRRFGRDVLINEDDFDEISDMHTFDRAQIQIT